MFLDRKVLASRISSGSFQSLVQNFDAFAWNPYEVPGVDPAFITHKLYVDPLVPLKKQKPRRSAKPHVKVVKGEVEKLKHTRAIREVFFPEWLSNTVVVKKKMRNGEFVLILPTSTKNVLRTHSLYRR